jgi:hypothetical protein
VGEGIVAESQRRYAAGPDTKSTAADGCAVVLLAAYEFPNHRLYLRRNVNGVI